MVGGNAGLQRGVYKDFALRIYLEDGAAAVADEKIAFRIKHCASGNPHSFGIECRLARSIDAVNIPLSARSHEEIPIRTERQSCRIQNPCHEWCTAPIGTHSYH